MVLSQSKIVPLCLQACGVAVLLASVLDGTGLAQPTISQPPPLLASPAQRLMMEQADELAQAAEVDEAFDLLEKLLDEAETHLVAVPYQQTSATLTTQRYIPLTLWIGERTAQLLKSHPEAAQRYQDRNREQAVTALSELQLSKDTVSAARIARRYAATELGPQFQLLVCDLELEQGWGIAASQIAHRISSLTRIPLPAKTDRSTASPSFAASLYAPYAWQQASAEKRSAEQAELWIATIGQPAWQSDPHIAQVVRRLVLAAAMNPGQLDLVATRAWARRIAADLSAEQRQGLLQFVAETEAWHSLKEEKIASAFATSRDVDLEEFRSYAVWPAWSQQLERYSASADRRAASKPRVAESERAILPYFPVVHDGKVFLNELTRVVAYDLQTGKSWPGGPVALPLFDSQISASAFIPLGYPLIGTPRACVEVSDNCLYARLGSPITGRVNAVASRKDSSSSYLIGLDLRKQGSMLPGFPLHLTTPDFSNAEFEGPPVAWGEMLLVAIAERDNVGLRRSVAAFHRFTGELVWKSGALADGAIAGAERANLISSQLLTLAGGRLFYNTNLGSIVCLDPMTGAIEWLVKYASRSESSEFPKPDRFRYRDLTPCLLSAGLVFCAPQDTPEIFALDILSGDLVWSTDDAEAADAIHLLGTHGETLIASGDRLLWLNQKTGRLTGSFPGATTPLPVGALPSPRGLGRGCIRGDSVYFPTSGEMFVFPASWANSDAREHVPPIKGRFHVEPSAMDGVNVLFAGDTLLVTSPSRLMAFPANKGRP